DGLAGIADVRVEGGAGRRRLEGCATFGPQEEAARRRAARRPVVAGAPAIPAGLEHESPRQVERPLVLQEAPEDGKLPLLAEVPARLRAELHRAKRVSGIARPSAVVPRSDDEVALVRGTPLAEP